MKPILEIRGLSKKYRLNHEIKPYLSLRDSVMDFFKGKSNLSQEEFWALKDVSFDVNPGESVAIIGKNGAGKSTLLKILSKITPPTSGSVKSRGRIASLLEVGTGFHSELNGRENIFLNGAILGMKKKEIQSKFDEIVDFSGVEKFLDTPLKNYSSGMQLRLAFAVAAFLEPEVLIIDEVLAVGDAEFQKKCMGKMENVSKSGRTILFVSHNMAAISKLCSKSLVLKSGQVFAPMQPTHLAVQDYLTLITEVSTLSLSERKDRQGEGKIKITDFFITDNTNNRISSIICGHDINFKLTFESSLANLSNIEVAISITTFTGTFITMLSNRISSGLFNDMKNKSEFTCQLKENQLSAGKYTINLIIRRENIIQDWIQEAYVLDVENGDFFGTGIVPPDDLGGVFFNQKWSVS